MHQRQQGGTCQRTTHTAYLTECCKHATAGVRLSRVIACQFSVVFETEYVNDFSLGCQKWKHTSLSATSTVISVSVLYTNSYCTFLTKQLFIVDSAYSIPSTMDSSSPSRIRTFSLRMTTQWRHSLQRHRQCANMTSSMKLEVHKVSQHRHRRTEPGPQITSVYYFRGCCRRHRRV